MNIYKFITVLLLSYILIAASQLFAECDPNLLELVNLGMKDNLARAQTITGTIRSTSLHYNAQDQTLESTSERQCLVRYNRFEDFYRLDSNLIGAKLTPRTEDVIEEISKGFYNIHFGNYFQNRQTSTVFHRNKAYRKEDGRFLIQHRTLIDVGNRPVFPMEERIFDYGFKAGIPPSATESYSKIAQGTLIACDIKRVSLNSQEYIKVTVRFDLPGLEGFENEDIYLISPQNGYLWTFYESSFVEISKPEQRKVVCRITCEPQSSPGGVFYPKKADYQAFAGGQIKDHVVHEFDLNFNVPVNVEEAMLSPESGQDVNDQILDLYYQAP